LKPKEQSSATKKGGVVIYQVGTDNIITEATKHLSDKLKIKHGKDNVMVVEKDKEGFCWVFVSLLSCVTGVLSSGVFVCSVTALSSCC
jgi:predicted DNA repair protein MutK